MSISLIENNTSFLNIIFMVLTTRNSKPTQKYIRIDYNITCISYIGKSTWFVSKEEIHLTKRRLKLPVCVSSFNTLSRPSSPPQAIYP